MLDNGGYTVQPVPAPFSTNELSNNSISEGGNNQKDILFNLGKAINIVIDSFLIMNLPNLSIRFRLCHPVNVTGWALVFGLLFILLTD
jgi:hypothetical protein